MQTSFICVVEKDVWRAMLFFFLVLNPAPYAIQKQFADVIS